MSQIDNKADNIIARGDAIPSSKWGDLISADTESIERRLLELRQEIAPCKPIIIGVTKYFGLQAIIKGYEAGIRNFGESRVVDAVEKIQALPENIREDSTFHFIGHLQTNKAAKAVEYFDVIHSVDSLKLAEIISGTACNLNKRERVLLQVNNAGEEQKFGYSREKLTEDFPKIAELENIEVIGLMNMAPLGAEEDELRKIFSELREFRDELEDKFSVRLPELSMGMSDDYSIAVQEGATMIRIGRKLFR